MSPFGAGFHLIKVSLSPGTPVYISWVDSKALSGWVRSGQHDVGHVETVGWVVEDHEEQITISASVSREGYNYDPFTIPKGCVKELVELGPFE